MLAIGIDEAGYGPLLGPLVVAGAAFRVDEEGDVDDFGKRLRAALRGAEGLRIGDSKRIFGSARDLSALERPVLAFAALHGAPATFDEMLSAAGVDPSARRGVAWYSGDLDKYPCSIGSMDVRMANMRLAGRLAWAGIEFLGFAAEIVSERRFNAALTKSNKADLLFTTSCDVAERLRQLRKTGESVATVFDRQGGRRLYGPRIQKRNPDALVMTVSESWARSDYVMRSKAFGEWVRFQVEADAAHAHVGLASMLAKYLREVHMELFNAHFTRICPGVQPTAGYVEDGRRWLEQTRDAREAAGIPDSDLVRQR